MPIIPFQTRDLIPQEFLDDIVTKSDGSFEVNVVLNSRLSEFRTSNVSLLKERDSLKQTLGSDTPETLATMRALQKRADAGSLTSNEAVEAELEKMRQGHKIELSEQRAINNHHKIAQEVQNAVNVQGSGIQVTAVADIIARAKLRFSVEENGALVPRAGGQIVYGQDGLKPETVGAWINSLRADNGHLFIQPAGGGGGQGGDQGQRYTGSQSEHVKSLDGRGKLAYANSTRTPV